MTSIHQSYADNYFNLSDDLYSSSPSSPMNPLIEEVTTLFDIIYIEDQINTEENGKRNRNNSEESIFNKKYKIEI